MRPARHVGILVNVVIAAMAIGSGAWASAHPQPLIPAAPGAVAIDGHGRTVIAGIIHSCPTETSCSGGRLYVGRLLRSGRIDRRFGGGDGFKTVAVSGPEPQSALILVGMAVMPDDGTVVVTRTFTSAALDRDPMNVVRITNRGKLDRAFGDQTGAELSAAGFVPASSYPSATSHGVDADGGSVLIAGTGGDGGHSLAVAKLTSTGDPDPSFGSGGIASVRADPDNAAEGASSLAVRADGRIVVGGYTRSLVDAQGVDYAGFAAARLHADGSPDASFAGDGTTEVAKLSGIANSLYENLGAWVTQITLQSSGRVLLTGARTLGKGACPDIEFFRLLDDGTPDRDFGNQGLSAAFRGCRQAATTFSGPDDSVLVAGRWEGADAYDDEFAHATFGQISAVGMSQGERAVRLPGAATAISGLARSRHGFVGVGSSSSRRCAQPPPTDGAPCHTAVVFRLRDGGSLDRRFGHRGIVRLPAVFPG